jgi:ubiquinone/menaquinone biosynthesis C-methylase UbiE
MFNIKTGNCIDIGSGPAALSISLARITNLQICAMDASKYSSEIAKNNIVEQGLKNRISTIIGSAEKMPFKDNFANLIISRGSIFFWDNLVNAFNEIIRVLKPGGKTYIGGGFGNSELRETIFKKMSKRNDDFFKNRRGMLNPENLKQIIKKIDFAVKQSNISKYDISQGDFEFWIHIKK